MLSEGMLVSILIYVRETMLYKQKERSKTRVVQTEYRMHGLESCVGLI